MLKLLFQLLIFLSAATFIFPQNHFEKDTIETSNGDLEITFIGHGTLMFSFNDKIIHMDPFGKMADYSELLDADYIFITHHHGDHFDKSAIDKIRTDNTVIVLTQTAAENFNGGTVMNNGDIRNFDGFKVEAVPAYNLVHMRDNGEPYHAKGECNGYVFTFGDKRVYVAGDTENTPEMKALKDIDAAFLPMNLPYTMTPEMVADAAKALAQGREAGRRFILYPYHYGETDVSKLVELMQDTPGVELRIRKMK